MPIRPASADELFELLMVARELIVELEKNRDLLKAQISGLKSEAVEVLELHESTVAHVGRLEAANTELATVNARLGTEVSALRDAHHDD